MISFKEAVDDLVVGLGNHLNKSQMYEYQCLDSVIKGLEYSRDSNVYSRYIYYLPKEFVVGLLKGTYIRNSSDVSLKIINLHWLEKKNDYVVLVSRKLRNGEKIWKMFLSTIIADCRFTTLSKAMCNKYFSLICPANVNNVLQRLEDKKKKYDAWFEQNSKRCNLAIRGTVNSKPSEVVVTRDAIRKSIRNIQQDSKVIANAWNSTLTKDEQSKLINWLANNIYSMRLYVTKGSRWDKALCELYPENIYGKHRQTEASELSKDSINGYISLSSTNGIPLDLLKKITHKEKDEDIIKQNKGSSKFRINNYLLVLYLLNNYNKNGFKLGKTGLNKEIKL